MLVFRGEALPAPFGNRSHSVRGSVPSGTVPTMRSLYIVPVSSVKRLFVGSFADNDPRKPGGLSKASARPSGRPRWSGRVSRCRRRSRRGVVRGARFGSRCIEDWICRPATPERGGGRLAVPQIVDEPVDRHEVAAGDDRSNQHGALTRSTRRSPCWASSEPKTRNSMPRRHPRDQGPRRRLSCPAGSTMGELMAIYGTPRALGISVGRRPHDAAVEALSAGCHLVQL